MFRAYSRGGKIFRAIPEVLQMFRAYSRGGKIFRAIPEVLKMFRAYSRGGKIFRAIPEVLQVFRAYSRGARNLSVDDVAVAVVQLLDQREEAKDGARGREDTRGGRTIPLPNNGKRRGYQLHQTDRYNTDQGRYRNDRYQHQDSQDQGNRYNTDQGRYRNDRYQHRGNQNQGNSYNVEQGRYRNDGYQHRGNQNQGNSYNVEQGHYRNDGYQHRGNQNQVTAANRVWSGRHLSAKRPSLLSRFQLEPEVSHQISRKPSTGYI
ncbi:hypothetical protein FJT64_024098 [Amphibalanus amphitrite]|uniref:Uncharacterized protein n=1 Tax=Amphibalanus amphitrite TaxID=1232801 RepID=A0A6A4WBK0_AMPAM|nr:hypothetical protein FJT64_024098 [Amphibalanus amphitrite]